MELHSPEPEPESISLAPSAPPGSSEDINLDTIPLPVYSLPTKPFPVQPPTKIGTGFAPVVPLDRSGKKVRQWRVANREIRGIAGGRWLTRSWVGDKDSEFASSAGAALKGGEMSHGVIALPRPESMAELLGMGKKPNKSRSGRNTKTAPSLTASGPPSRSESVVPDVGSSAVRAPTKMRTIVQLAPQSEAGDSDMLGPSET